MEAYEDDDDTHFCIKCHSTIHGLENYVRHRQSGCRPPEDNKEVVRVLPSTSSTVSYPEILNADAFFSSLELQSSSKLNRRRGGSFLVERGKLAKNERRKKREKSEVEVEESRGKEKLENMLPGVTDLEDPTDHLCIPSLVGFPDIVSSSGKPVTSAGQNLSQKLSQSITQSGSNIESSRFPAKHEPENSLESLMTESKQSDGKRHEESQRIEQDHQAWLEDTILADLVGNNENKDLTRYEFEYQQEEDSEDDILEEDLGDEDSYSESEDGEDRERPPRGHTGGKWKPGSEDLPQNMSQLQEDDVEPEDENQQHPPANYTGGKWKPTETSQLRKIEEYETKGNPGQPPPEHTRGKWVPGTPRNIEPGYWCNPCGRKLASRLLYNRHLLSDLHARRSINEIEDVPHLRAGEGDCSSKKSSSRIQRMKETKETKEIEERERKKSLRRREKEVVFCEMCHIRVRRAQMGKHLLSHYHCRVAGINPRGPRARRFLLENMANVVRQCPFQCSSCRFYCNTEETFLLHWRSDLHARTVNQIAGSYRCTPCDFWCESNEAIESHLASGNHREVVSMMNRSVPVVIARRRILSCSDCERRFRYNLQLRLHIRETGHGGSSTASDEHQQFIKCNVCSHVVRSLVSLQRHQLSYHIGKTDRKKEEQPSSSTAAPYFCTFCSMNFTTAREAVLHRRTSSHKETVKARKYVEGLSSTTTRECPHCNQKQSNLAEHKEHLLRYHGELCHSCPKCGRLFALSQDVTRHTRENDCQKDDRLKNVKASTSKEEWKCDNCDFSTDSKAEIIFHGALHVGSVEGNSEEEASGRKLSAKYSCPICKKVFAKVSLRNHIRSHTGERPFPCAKCSASFSRRSDLNAHQKICTSATPSSCTDESRRTRNFVCPECANAFYTRHALRQHMLRHAGKKYKCGLPGCPTVLRTASELKSHRSLVHESTSSERRYACSDCTYAAKTKTQLRRHRARHGDPAAPAKPKQRSCPYSGCDFKTTIRSHLWRHMIVHTGTKPYKCRHCSYASNNLENLRKHVLSTNLHPGKTIYECNFCEGKDTEIFSTNFSKELRAHLLASHPDTFPTARHASDYVFGIFASSRGPLST